MIELLNAASGFFSIFILPIFWYVITIERRISKIEGKLEVKKNA